MAPRIEILKEKKLVGLHLAMSLSDNKTTALWKRFMPRRAEITHQVTSDLISMQLYSPLYFANFNPGTEFTKWAAVEVSTFESIPQGMETFLLTGGLYAVFDYKGHPNDGTIFKYIFGTWLPESTYTLDERPHFEVLGEKYKNNDPTSEEEIWIPIKPK